MKSQNHLPRMCGGTCGKLRVVIGDFSERVRTELRKLINDTLLKSGWMTDTYKNCQRDMELNEWASRMAEEIQ